MNVNESCSTALWQSLRRWSAEQLELSVEPTAAAARSVALRKLSEWDFAPPDRWQQACELLLACLS